ncbi:hypothetical protein M3J09_002435 [Ascochyta lentis]
MQVTSLAVITRPFAQGLAMSRCSGQRNLRHARWRPSPQAPRLRHIVVLRGNERSSWNRQTQG